MISALLAATNENDADLKNLCSMALAMFSVDGVSISLVDKDISHRLASAGTAQLPDLWPLEAEALTGARCLVRRDGSGNPGFVATAPFTVAREPVGVISILSAVDKPTFESDDQGPGQGQGQQQGQQQLERLAKLAGSLVELKRNARLGRSAMEALHREEDRNAVALEAGHVGSWVWDLKTGLFTGNKMAYSMLGLSEENPVTGEDVFRAMHPDDFPLMKMAITRAMAHNEDYVGEFRAASSGQWLLGRGRIFERDETGRPAVAVGVNIDITEAKSAGEKTRLLLRELNHRVKNTLAMLQSLARQTLNRTSDPAEFMEAFSGRLRAISEAHTLLSDREWSGISLVDLVTRQVEPYALYDSHQLELVGEDMILPPDHALGLGIALHELATNAAKHGAFSAAAGKVRVSWQTERGLDGSRVVIQWTEMNGPPVMPRGERGLGERLIERSLDKVISSSVRLSYPPTGMEALISMPIEDGSSTVTG
ncbi:sensor histidine kinase [Phyllobacterium sp. 0TCS1.6A]|uniref:sensor histidine kinase n=1 Tax=Phyllobacterium sp. 0TCS1.6A TaxID=2995637 RepID=UPI002263DFEA|nr:HWE histidine kinase domain-containing protein [Phyllobacterium sp. 0TCS1.6A]MCX8293140.1 PAS domain-containing protein [Phyllobacterium sp. 0TCS1.6A]